MRRGEPHVLLDRAPRQQPRLLEHHAERAVGGQLDAALEIAVEPGDDPQQRGLAAAGRPDQRGDLAAARLNASSPSTWSLPPAAARKDFLLDVDVKPAAGASGRHVVQAAAPGTFRLPA